MAKRILIVEDNDDVREMVVLMLRTEGHETVEARDGHEAVEVAEKYCPDLILMDIGLPKMDGLTATEKIGRLANCSNTPVIALTAYSDMRESALAAGCVSLLEKPIDLSRLLAAVEPHLA